MITDHTVLEVNKQGETVWQFSQADAPEYKFFIFQEASRLANGDTVICNWCPHNLRPEALAQHGAGAGSDAGQKNGLGVETMG